MFVYIVSSDKKKKKKCILFPIKKKKVLLQELIGDLGSVWYVCLKTENCCLKIFIEIRVDEKVY